MIIQFASFVGMKPELTDKLIPENYAVKAINCNTDDGSISAWDGLKYVQDLGKTGVINTLYRMVSGTFLHWNEIVTVARTPLANNTIERVIFTGTDKPRYTDANLAVSGGGLNNPETSYWLGIPPPTNPLTVSVTQNTANGIQLQYTIAGTVDDTIGDRISRSYVYTFITGSSIVAEGAPSPPSDLAYSNSTEQLTLSNFQGIPTGAYDIVGIRIYVSVNGSNFLFIKELSLPVTNYVDNTTMALGNAIETTLWSPPLDSLDGVKNMANGMVAGYTGNDIYFCEPYNAQGWPEDYRQTLDYNINGLSASGNMLLITTDGHPYTGIGNLPSQIVLDKLQRTQGNVNRRSLVDIGNGVMYSSPDGVVWISDNTSRIVSEDIISEHVWQLIKPDSVHAYFYRDKYFGFYDSGLTGNITSRTGEILPAKGGFILDYKRGTVTYTDVYCDSAYSDTRTGRLYLCIQENNVNKIYEWNGDINSSLVSVWRSKTISVKPTVFSAARVDSKKYPLNFSLIADDVIKHTISVTNDNVFRLPSGYLARDWSIEIDNANQVDGIFLATSPSEL